MPALETAAPFHEVRIHPRTGAVVPLNIGWLSPLLSTDDDWYDPEELTVAVHANFDGRYGVRLSAVPRNGSVVVLDMSNPSSSLELTQTTSTPGIGEFWVAEQGAQSDYGQVNLGFGFIEVHSSMSGVLVEVHYQSVGSVLSNDVINDKISTEVASQLVASTPYDPGLISGLLISNNVTDPTNDIDIAAGYARDATNTVNMILAAAITKRLDGAWAVGTNQGGLDTGAIANTTYHLWLIKRSDTGVVDVLFSASATSPTMPANYDYKAYIGAVIRVSGALLLFKMRGDRFVEYMVPILDVNGATLGTSATNYTISIPSGVICEVDVHESFSTAVGFSGLYVFAPDLTDATASNSAAPLVSSGGGDNASTLSRKGNVARKYSDTSSRVRATAVAASTTVYIATVRYRVVM